MDRHYLKGWRGVGGSNCDAPLHHQHAHPQDTQQSFPNQYW